MIIKSFEINKIDFAQNKLVLFYGKNEGFKNEATNNLIKEKDEVTKYEEKEVLENINNFIESILSKSLLEYFLTQSFFDGSIRTCECIASLPRSIR